MKSSITSSEIDKLLKFLSTKASGAAVLHYNPEEALTAIKKHFTVIQAAGGLVHTPSNEILLIYRRKKWDLPKGKLESEEQLDVCALREVQEETGLAEMALKELLCVTYHTYVQDNEQILKESYWYRMEVPTKQLLVPQLEEDIEKCQWVNYMNLAPYLENTHPSVIDVLKEGIKVFDKQKN